MLKKYFREAILLISTFLFILIVSFSLPTSSQQRLSELPKAVIIDSLKGNGHYFRRNNQQAVVARQNGRFGYGRRYGISGSRNRSSGSRLKFLSRAGYVLKGYLVVAGFSRTPAEYFYPCNGSGSITVGWNAGAESRGCQEISYNGNRILGRGTRVKPKLDEDKFDFEKTYGEDGITAYYKQSCSVSTASEEHWKVRLGDLDEPIDVCERSIEDCQAEFGERCYVTSRADWRDYDPDATTLTVALDCDEGQTFSQQVKGYTLEERDVPKAIEAIENRARSQGARSCALKIYSSSQVLIQPSSSNRTLIHADSTKTGFKIRDLVGSVKIRSSDSLSSSEDGEILLSAGESYTYLRDEKQGFKEPISRSECSQVVEYPAVRNFLSEAQWLEEDIRPEIPEYQKALNSQFYRSPRVSVERLSNTEGWLATMDMDGSAQLKIEPNTGQSFAKASEQIGTLAMGGVYRWGNWQLISEGRQLNRSQQSPNLYSALVFDQQNNLALITPTDGRDSRANWDEYQFALQAGPRLVRSGQASVSGASARREGHRTLDVSTRTRRAGIGLSQDKKTLYYVIAEGASLPRLAEIMAAQGAYDAMALDGGNGPALAFGGEVQVPLESNQTFFITAQPSNTGNSSQPLGCK